MKSKHIIGGQDDFEEKVNEFLSELKPGQIISINYFSTELHGHKYYSVLIIFNVL